MSAYVAFLRAINVAGHARVKMDDLKKAFADAGCANVRSYIQSGNVLFDIPAKDAKSAKHRIQEKLSELLGFEPIVMYRTLRELQNILKTSPFRNIESDGDVKLYVAFLAQKPRCTTALPLRLPKEGLEVVEAKNLEVYIVSRRKKNGGFGFPKNFIEKEFGGPATARNWNTVKKVVER